MHRGVLPYCLAWASFFYTWLKPGVNSPSWGNNNWGVSHGLNEHYKHP